MDPITHGLTGAAAAHLVSGDDKGRLPLLVGFLSAQIPDFDVIFQSIADPLTAVELHRHFTHSLLFAPVGAAIAAAIFWLFLKKKIAPGKLYAMVLAAYISAVLLDACTSYGTHLLWPVSGQTFAWNLVPVVHPVITAGMLVCITYSLKGKHKKGTFLAMLWLVIFLGFGAVQHYRASVFGSNYVHQKTGDPVGRHVVKPTLGNLVLWRYTFTSADSVHAFAVRAGMVKGMRIYPGESAKLRLPDDAYFSQNISERKRQDVVRFYCLSEGYMISHPEKEHILGDARYSMLPTQLVPLWGIDISGKDDDSPSPFLYFRDSGEEFRKTYINMLLGEDTD